MPMIDLNSLIEQHAPTRLIKTATTAGGEYAGPCPWCGGTDRMRVWPFSTRPHYWCRNCQQSGDAIQFLKDYKHLSYVEACNELGVEPGQQMQHEAPLWFDDDPPCKEWQAFGRVLAERAQVYLWEKGHEALAYLLKRGLNEETIRAAQLGYVPLGKDGKWFQRPFADWGLTDEMLTEKQKAKGGVKVPPGILIPWFGDGQLWKLAVKRFEAGPGEQKYGQVVGSRDSLYNYDSLARGEPVLLCEGEFDVLSAQQEAGDLAAAIGTGSTAKGRTPLWIARLASRASCVLLSFDNDEEHGAGDKASDAWLEILPEALRWPPLAHDLNDMLKEGKSIRKWLVRGLGLATMTPVAEEVPESPPPPQAPLESFNDWLARLEAEIDTASVAWCSQCDADVEAYTPDGKPLCARCWEVWQHAQRPFLSVEHFAQHVAQIGAEVCDCTVTIVPSDYTLARRVAEIEAQPRTWADYRK